MRTYRVECYGSQGEFLHKMHCLSAKDGVRALHDTMTDHDNYFIDRATCYSFEDGKCRIEWEWEQQP